MVWLGTTLTPGALVEFCSEVSRVAGMPPNSTVKAAVRCREGPMTVPEASKVDFDRTIGIHPTAAEEFVTLRSLARVAGVSRATE